MNSSDGAQEEITLKMRRVLGAASPYSQGGSLRITLPRQVAQMYGLEKWSFKELEKKVFVFVETDKGILVVPLEKVLELKELGKHISTLGQ